MKMKLNTEHYEQINSIIYIEEVEQLEYADLTNDVQILFWTIRRKRE